MDKVKVLVTHRSVTREDMETIRAVAQQVDAVYAPYPDLTGPELSSPMERREEAQHSSSESADFAGEIGEAQVIFGLELPDDVLDLAPKLGWVQGFGAGVDRLEKSGLFNSRVTVTNSAGSNAGAMAEFVVMLMLQQVKNLPERLGAQREHRWARYDNRELRGATLGIIGAGYVAQALARLVQAFGMRVMATRRRFTEGETLPDIDRIYPREGMHDMLGQSDWVVAAMSLSQENRRMLGPAEFSAMKRGAYFINIARGALVDQPALLQALKSGRLSGAGIDVFDPEPLPADSEFWELPNVVVSAHNSGGVSDYSVRATQQFCANLRRFLGGEPLANVVSPRTGMP